MGERIEKLKEAWQDSEYGQPVIVFLSLAVILFCLFLGFFGWHTVRMRDHELSHVKMRGTIVDVEKKRGQSAQTHASRTYYYLVISYNYEGQKYTFTDNVGYQDDVSYRIGDTTQVYVDPKNPDRAEKVTSAGFVSIICSCFFAFFCVTYAAGMNIFLSKRGSSFLKRLEFVWGVEILLGIAFVLLFWAGLPHSGIGEVFSRIEGAVGVTVTSEVVALIALLDGLISCKRRSLKGN